MALNNNELNLLNELLNKLDDNQKASILEKLNISSSKNSYIYTIEECPYCHSKHIVKFGKYRNIQKYVCKDCHKHFRETENTIIKKTRKDINVWKKYIQCMIDEKSLREISEICGLSLRTAFEWRHKILDILSSQMNDVKLNGIVECDETYFRVSYKGNHKKSKDFILPRKPHKRGGAVHKRGLSKEQVCVSTAVKKDDKYFGKVSNLGMPKIESIYNILKEHIEKDTILVTDNYKGYNEIVKRLGINHIPIPKDKHSNGTFKIQKINSYHSNLKRLINCIFRGVSTKYLNNYLVYLNFINLPKVKIIDKITNLQDYIFKSRCSELIKRNERPAIPA